MNYIFKIILGSFVFSLFFLVSIQANNIINKVLNKSVLGVSTDNVALCNSISTIYRQYCSSSPTPINIGSTNNSSSTPISVSAITSSDGKSAAIIWRSNQSTTGVIEYGTTPASLLLRAVETKETISHRVYLSPLKPGVNYYYRIRVGSNVYDNNGIPFSFKTKLNN